MLALPPRVEGLAYEIIYGLTVFRCTALRATIQPSACSINFTEHRCLACKNCTIGAIHASKQAPPPLPGNARNWALDYRPKAALDFCITKTCIRCCRPSPRIVGKAFCPSCWNRSLEVVHGRNGKGDWPRVTASILHRCNAIFEAPAFKYPEPCQTLRISRYGTGYWLSGLLSDAAELARLLARIAPGAVLVDAEFLPVKQS
jgi:hypothetical protein